MKNILFSMSLLGILLNPLTAGSLWTLTPENTDSYTINNNLPDGTPISNVQDILIYLDQLWTNNPGTYNYNITNLGKVWSLPGNKLVEMTTLTTDPWSGPPNHGLGMVIVTEDNSTNPSTFKFEQVVATPYQGAPLVSGVYAQQEPGTKNVRIDFSLVLASHDDPVMGDKSSFLEFWFKSDPSSPQWEECIMFESAGGAPGSPGGNQKQPGAINQSGQFYAIWKAGDQKPNFQTSTGKIRVMVTYDHEDPNNPGTTIQGSQWDGYEVENGPMFVAHSTNNTLINYNPAGNQVSEFHMWVNDPTQNHISRIGSFENNGEKNPVYQLSENDILSLTGSAGQTPGKYAFGLVDNPPYGPTYKLIPVE